MATITGKPHLFFITSPRSPYKMKDEVRFLTTHYSGQVWNHAVQQTFLENLVQSGDFKISLSNDPAFQARDRITRGPKSLGLVDLHPTISITPAGEAYLFGKRPHEAFTRQLLKFQLPSPYHRDLHQTFAVRPYLELLRLIYDLEYLSKEEIAIFAIQLIHIDKYDLIKQKILDFRQRLTNLKTQKINRKDFIKRLFIEEIKTIYHAEIQQGKIATRQSVTNDIEGFATKKRNNFIDYADAAIRYLRETRLVTLRSAKSNHVRIPLERKAEVEYILNHTSRLPQHFNNEQEFKLYLFDATNPLLLSDNRVLLIQQIRQLDQNITTHLEMLSIEELKDIKEHIIDEQRKQEINRQLELLKSYSEYTDIVTTYEDILAKKVSDPPLMLEWNTWRAFAMLDDGDIIANFNFDDSGMPLSTAAGNQSDIICCYNDFDLLIEVTLSSGMRQYEMEGEPVARHIGRHRADISKATYCIFVAKELSDATIAHFYMLHKTNIRYYGGKTRIIPLTIHELIEILDISHRSVQKPTAQSIRMFVEQISTDADHASDEEEWRTKIHEAVSSWGQFIADR